MLSKVKIDLNERNEPIIVIEWQPSDDLRDKIVKQFIEGFGYDSNEAVMKFEKTESDYKRISIAPVLKENHVLTAEDFRNNPEFIEEGLNVGDKIGIPAKID